MFQVGDPDHVRVGGRDGKTGRHRRERQTLFEFHGTTNGESGSPCGSGTGDRTEQGRLADARLSSDQQEVATSGREAVGEDGGAVQLDGPAYQFAGHLSTDPSHTWQVCATQKAPATRQVAGVSRVMIVDTDAVANHSREKNKQL